MTNIHLEITAEDIEAAGSLSTALPHSRSEWPLVGPTPASVALERVMGSCWKTVGALLLLEERAPYRLAIVPAAITPLLEQFLSTGEMPPCELDLDFTPSLFELQNPAPATETIAA